MCLRWSDTCLAQPNGVIITAGKGQSGINFIMASECVSHQA
jgi:hypothetical protein